jgi:hypothetical protein
LKSEFLGTKVLLKYACPKIGLTCFLRSFLHDFTISFFMSRVKGKYALDGTNKREYTLFKAS